MSNLPVRLSVEGIKQAVASVKKIKKGVKNFPAQMAALKASLLRLEREAKAVARKHR